MSSCRGLDNLLAAVFVVGIRIGFWLRFSSLSYCEGSGPPRDHGKCNASEDKARKYGNRQHILLDLLVPANIGQAEYNVLNLVVDPTAGLEGPSLRIWGQIVQVGLEKPKGLSRISLAGPPGESVEHMTVGIPIRPR